jgi:excisionase family DNA binding protein
LETSERWLSVEEIAGHLGVSKETIHRWLSKSKIPAHRVGKLWKFRSSEVDTWVTKGGAEEPAATVEKNVKSKTTKKTARKG